MKSAIIRALYPAGTGMKRLLHSVSVVADCRVGNMEHDANFFVVQSHLSHDKISSVAQGRCLVLSNVT